MDTIKVILAGLAALTLGLCAGQYVNEKTGRAKYPLWPGGPKRIFS